MGARPNWLFIRRRGFSAVCWVGGEVGERVWLIWLGGAACWCWLGGGAAAGGGLDVSAGLHVFWRGCWGSAITCSRFSWRWGFWCRARLPTVTSGAGAMLVVADFLLQGALVGGGGVAVDALWRVRWRCREVSDFRGPLWTARVDAPTLVHDLTQRRFSRAGFSWRPSRWCRRPLGGSRGSRGGGWRALSGCSLPVGIMEAPAAGAGSVAMRVMGPGEVSDASPGLVEPVESVRGLGPIGWVSRLLCDDAEAWVGSPRR